jgi:hypothetical protein
MPPLAAANGCIKVQLIGVNQGALWMNNLHFATEGLVAVPQDTLVIDTFLTNIASSWGANIAPLCNTAAILQSLTFTDLTASDRVQYTATLVDPVEGTRAGTTLPTSAAMVISWRVSNRYRGGHGRSYVPAGCQADVTNGRLWAAAFTTAANSSVAAFRTAIDGLSVGTQPVNLVVLSYFSGSHKTPADPHPAPVPRATPLPMRVISARVRGRLDSQRRRLGKEVV